MEMDEKILQMKNAVKAAAKEAHSETVVECELKHSIYDGRLEIFGIPAVFAERALLGGQITLQIPEDFIELEVDVVKNLYPLGNRPQVVMGNEAFQFMLGFNHTEHRVPEAYIKDFPGVARAMLEKCGPKVTVTESGAISCGGRSVATLSFVSQTLNGALYNMMFYSNVGARLLIGFFNFRFADRSRLEPLCREIIASYRILETYGGEGK